MPPRNAALEVLPAINSPRNAPRNGPAIRPIGKKKNPTMVPTKQPHVPQREQLNFLAPNAGIIESAMVTISVIKPKITNVETEGQFAVGIRQKNAA